MNDVIELLAKHFFRTDKEEGCLANPEATWDEVKEDYLIEAEAFVARELETREARKNHV